MNPPRTSNTLKKQQNFEITIKCNQQEKQTTRTNNPQQPKAYHNKPANAVQSKPQNSGHVKHNQNFVAKPSNPRPNQFNKPQGMLPERVDELTEAFKLGLLMNSAPPAVAQPKPRPHKPATNQPKPSQGTKPKAATQKIVIASSGAKNVVVNINPKSNIKIQKK